MCDASYDVCLVSLPLSSSGSTAVLVVVCSEVIS
nr:MAG TPA: hypothetical protein [Caudoviricetes sp.]